MTRPFARFTRSSGIANADLLAAVDEVASGRIDASLGGGLIKQRIARAGSGKSGGYRTILAWQRGERAVFIYGFAKSDRGNVSDSELKALKLLARSLLALDGPAIGHAVERGVLVEVVA